MKSNIIVFNLFFEKNGYVGKGKIIQKSLNICC